jgi:transposase
MVVIMSKRYPPEVREKAVRLALERLDEYESPYAAARAIGPMVDVHHETLRIWIKKALAEGTRPGTQAAPDLSSEESAELTRLRREVAELRRANDILKAASAFFARELCATRRRDDRGGVRDLSRRAVAVARRSLRAA